MAQVEVEAKVAQPGITQVTVVEWRVMAQVEVEAKVASPGITQVTDVENVILMFLARGMTSYFFR
jgi:hypothetical protein